MFAGIKRWLREKRIAEEVAKHGWAIIPVEALPGQARWAYSVGLATKGIPELIAFGSSAADAARVLDFVKQGLDEGRLAFEDGLRWKIDGGDELCVRRVHESQYLGFGWFAHTKDYHERRTGRREAVDAFQVFLPDLSGRYPWEAGCDEEVRAGQPRLYLRMNPDLPYGGAFADAPEPPLLDPDALLEQELERIDERIQRDGWSVVCVGSYAQGQAFAYTAGFGETLGQPELIIFDAPCHVANNIAAEIYSLLKGGYALEDGKRWPDDDAEAGVWRKVHPSHIGGERDILTLTLARKFRRTGSADGVEAYQYVLADRAHRLPWEPGYDEGLRHLQPALWEPSPAAA